MQLTINGKEYNFKFGVKFVRELDKEFGVVKEGISFGMALNTKVPELFGGSATALSDFLYAASVTESPRPSADDIDDFVDTVKDIEPIFDEVIKELEESNAGKLAMRSMKEQLKGNKKKK